MFLFAITAISVPSKCIYIKSSTPSAFLTDETSWYILTGNTLFGYVDFLVLTERILSLISNKEAVHMPVCCTLHEGTFRALRNSGCSTLLLNTALSSSQRRGPRFYTSSQRGSSKTTTAHLRQCLLAPSIPGAAPQALGWLHPSASSQGNKPRAVMGRAGSQTDIWASDVPSDVLKETLNTFKVNLMTSCYPEKAKYRKNKDLTCTCIYYGQLMLTECFALILDLH